MRGQISYGNTIDGVAFYRQTKKGIRVYTRHNNEVEYLTSQEFRNLVSDLRRHARYNGGNLIVTNGNVEYEIYYPSDIVAQTEGHNEGSALLVIRKDGKMI